LRSSPPYSPRPFRRRCDPKGSEGNREIFVVKKIDDRWKFYRYIFNAEVKKSNPGESG
jgi:hypothetical protein